MSERPFRARILYAGGTIGMKATPSGLRPGASLEAWVSELIAKDNPNVVVDLVVYDPLIDSSNARPSDWQRLIDDARKADSEVDGVLILHGTDTMSYTAAALDCALADPHIPVVITGAQLPLTHPRSDAAENVLGAMRCLVEVGAGVGLFFNGTLFQGARVQKVSLDDFAGFSSPNFPPSGRVSTEGTFEQYLPLRLLGPGWQPDRLSAPYTDGDDQEVVVTFLTPGMSESRLRAHLTPAPAGVLLLGYGAGNGPETCPDLPGIIAELTEAGTVTVILSQCHEGRVDLTTYATGAALAHAGAISGGRMTIEAAYAKLKLLLAQGLDPHKVRRRFQVDLVGEM